MKKWMLFFVVGLVCNAVNAQKWDSTYRPANYQQKLANFKSYPNSKKDIIFLGNSITDYTNWNELLQLPNAKNRGISGDISFGVLQRLGEVTEGKPAKVFILIGINDIARNIPDSVILDNYKRMVERIRVESPKTKIYFNNLLPVNNGFANRAHFNKDEHIAHVNAGLLKLCTEKKITYINIHDAFLDENKKLNKAFTYDGLHLNAEGYQLWAKILKPYILL